MVDYEIMSRERLLGTLSDLREACLVSAFLLRRAADAALLRDHRQVLHSRALRRHAYAEDLIQIAHACADDQGGSGVGEQPELRFTEPPAASDAVSWCECSESVLLDAYAAALHEPLPDFVGDVLRSHQAEIASMRRWLARVEENNGQATRVMVVDDDDELRAVLSINLAECGFDVIEAYDGQDAIDKLERTAPHVILLDLMMPRLSGHEFLKTLPEGASCQVVVFSAYADDAPHTDPNVAAVLSKTDDFGRVVSILRAAHAPRPDAELLRS
jgi:CheY-like chemotaxis protein